jgi:AraC-like DNA-binding protein
MHAHFEKIADEDQVIHSFERTETNFPFHWHYHPECELTLILEGSGQRLVGDSIEEYGPGDLVLLGPNLPHTYRSSPIESRNSALVLQFRPDLLGDRFFALPEMASLKQFLSHASRGYSFAIKDRAEKTSLITRLRALPKLPNPTRVLELLAIIDFLAHKADLCTLSHSVIPAPVRVEDQQRINTICSYLCEHFEEKLDYRELTKRVHMSQASICRFFRRATGRTMTDYANEYRISVASQLLKDTDKSILDIALEVGFGNYSHFVRQFQRSKGTTPRTFRANFLNEVARVN